MTCPSSSTHALDPDSCCRRGSVISHVARGFGDLTLANAGDFLSDNGALSRRDRQRTLRESSLQSNSLPSRRSLRERAAAELAGQTESEPAPFVAAEPTPPRRRRDARAAVRSERPTSPEDVPIVEETIALTPVWADPTADASDAEPIALPEPAEDDSAAGQPVPADTFVPLSSVADSSTIAASFIAPPSSFHRPRFAPSPEGSAPVPAARANTQAATPRPSRWRSLRSPAIIALAIPALLGTVALPAYAFSPGTGSDAIADANAALTVETSAVQSLTVSDDVTLEEIERDGYTATSAEELEQTYAAAGYIYDSAAALAGYLAPSSSGWWRPLPGEITSKYGPRGLICNGAGCSSSFHEGMDFGGACGTPIKATAAGTVSFTGNAGAFGNRVIIDHGDGLQTIYGHLLGGSYTVAVGDVIEGGTVIAEVGATGVVSGCHLDLKVSVDGEHTNPAPFLREHGDTV